MKPAPDDLEDLRAQTAAHKFLINALLIALTEKGVLSPSDVTVLIEASIVSLEAAGDPFLAKVIPHIDEFRSAIAIPPLTWDESSGALNDFLFCSGPGPVGLQQPSYISRKGHEAAAAWRRCPGPSSTIPANLAPPVHRDSFHLSSFLLSEELSTLPN